MITKGLLGLFLLLLSLPNPSGDKPVLKGTVSDAEDETYLQGAVVSVKNCDGNRVHPPVITDGAQSFKIEDLAKGEYIVKAKFSGFKPYDKTIALKQGKEKEIKLELKRKE